MATEPAPSVVQLAVKQIADLAQRADLGRVLDIIDPRADAGLLPKSVPLLIERSPNGQAIHHSLKPLFDQWLTRPERRTGTAKALTLKSFIDLVNRHKDDDSALFASTTWPNPSLLAMIDYHQKDGVPRFGKHRIAYTFPVSPECTAWFGMNGAHMGQGQFAEFVEDRIAEIASPFDAERTQYESLFSTKFATAADMMKLSRGLAVKVETQVSQHRVLQTGESEMVFAEEHKTAAGDGKLIVPGLFVINIPMFVGSEAVRFISRLRYRVHDGKVKWFFHLYRWDEVVREAIEADVKNAADATELPAYEGTPEA